MLVWVCLRVTVHDRVRDHAITPHTLRVIDAHRLFAHARTDCFNFTSSNENSFTPKKPLCILLAMFFSYRYIVNNDRNSLFIRKYVYGLRFGMLIGTYTRLY